MVVLKDIVKLDKKELNELLYYIYEDNVKYGLILKLIYVYGRSIKEVLSLKASDIDDRSIEFQLPTERFNFILYTGLKKELNEYINCHNCELDDFLFIDDEKHINKYNKNLNYYLQSKINELNKIVLDFNCPLLVTGDFKKLRGQHLFLDGASINVVNELYRNRNIQTTKNHIKYDELKSVRENCNSLDKVFKEYTDLRVFHDSSFDDVDCFLVVDEGSCDEVVFTFDYNNMVVNWVDKSNCSLIDVFKSKDLSCEDLKKLDVGDYFLFGDLRVVKN